MCAQRRLEAEEFLSAIAVDPRGHPHTLDKTSLLDICCNLVVYEPLQNVFRLAHLSVREYFETNLGWNSSISNALAAERRLDVLWGLAGSNMSATATAHNHQLDEYATSCWSYHYRFSMASDLDQQLLRTKLLLFWSNHCHENSSFTKWLVSSTNQVDTCRFSGFNALKHSLLDFISLFQWAGVLERNNQCDNQSTSITNGQLAYTLIRLLRRRPDLASALQCSVVEKNERLVRLFIGAGDQLNIFNSKGETALALAIRQDSPGISRILLKNGAIVSEDSTAVALGVKHGSSELVNLLLEAGLIVHTSLCKNNLHPRRIAAIYQELKGLCRRPVSVDLHSGIKNTSRTEVLSSTVIESISRCLGYLGYEDFQQRPRTYAILYMMQRTDLMHYFVSESLFDDSLSHLDGQSLPGAVRSDSDTYRQFLELKIHAAPRVQTPAVTDDVPWYWDDPYACDVPGSFPESPKSFEIAKPRSLPDPLNMRAAESGDPPSQAEQHDSALNVSAEFPISSHATESFTGDTTQEILESPDFEVLATSQQPPTDDLGLRSLLEKAGGSIPITSEVISKYLEAVHNTAAGTYNKAISSNDSVTITSMSTLRSLPSMMLPLQDRSQRILETYCKQGKTGAVRLLLKSGCNPGTVKNPRPGPIFHVVKGASSRHTKCLRLLIAHGVNVNIKASRTGKTPLMIAVDQPSWSGYATVVYLLLAAGADPNLRDATGDAALLQLLHGGSDPLDENRRSALALLLHPSYNTNSDLKIPASSSTPLHLAISRNDPWAVAMLLNRNNASLESKNVAGLTPLQVASSFWRPDMTPTMTSSQLSILDLLLEGGARVNVLMEDNDKTPLHIAVSYGLTQIAQRLLSSGAEPRLRTRDGKTVHDLADERKKQHGCKDCEDCSTMREVLLKGYGYIDLKLAEYTCFGYDENGYH